MEYLTVMERLLSLTEADFDPVRLGEVLRAGRVNCLWLTAGLFNLVVDLLPSALEGVAHVLTGGDVLSIPHVRRAFAALPGIRITNGAAPQLLWCRSHEEVETAPRGSTSPACPSSPSLSWCRSCSSSLLPARLRYRSSKRSFVTGILT